MVSSLNFKKETKMSKDEQPSDKSPNHGENPVLGKVISTEGLNIYRNDRVLHRGRGYKRFQSLQPERTVREFKLPYFG